MKNHNPCGNSLSDLMEVLQERNETIDQLRSEIKRLSMSSSTCLLNDFTRDSIFLCSISNNITGSPKMLYESDKIYAYLDTPLIDDKVLRAPKRKNTQHATQTNAHLFHRILRRVDANRQLKLNKSKYKRIHTSTSKTKSSHQIINHFKYFECPETHINEDSDKTFEHTDDTNIDRDLKSQINYIVTVEEENYPFNLSRDQKIPEKTFSYEELFKEKPSDIDPERLEWYLHDEDLMEYLGICRDFLDEISRVDLDDRKYMAGLTASQYAVSRKIC